MNCIAYSLFGYNNENKDCYDFKSYFRYLSLNMRMKELLYPDWCIYIAVDEQTYDSPYKAFFDYHVNAGKMVMEIVPLQPLCAMMLYRTKPIFRINGDGSQFADRVICRDIDSLFSYRERQAVQYWVNGGRVAHAITDSISHTVPLMGGMVGFMSQQLRDRLGVNTFEQMLEFGRGLDYNVKGTDQDFLNRVILPKVKDSITEHYILGMPPSGNGDCHHHIQPTALPISSELQESNYLVNHVGQSGCGIEAVLKFFGKFLPADLQAYYDEIEKSFDNIFYWQDKR